MTSECIFWPLSPCQKQQVLSEVADGLQASTYLGSQFELDLIHKDEPVRVMWLRPAQKHPVVMALPGYWAWYVVSLF